ncbi:MAG: ABC-F family ATP-binding cassette domain-containing protein, partial [Clostridia bacterium]|nr:ABC-F family ATP-binding cassette domain-containing protein [Clostridia bacterium]
LTLAYGSNVLLSNLNFVLGRGQKVALLGLNGSGKSTLIRRIAAANPQDLGKIVFGKYVRTGFYDQENLNLQGNLRVIDQLWFDNTRMSQTEVRGLLAKVTLGADDVYKLVSELSGGERAKLGLAMIMAKDCNLLLLDEPTNHLDLPSREALEEALRSYTGTVLFVSHDRYFVNAISSSIAEIDQGALNVYQGNYDDFAQKTFAQPDKKVTKSVTQTGYRNAKQRAEQTNNARKLKQLEQTITQLEEQILDINNQLANPTVASDYSKMSPLLQQLEQCNLQLEETMLLWEELSQLV